MKGHIGLTRLVAVKTIKDGAGSKERDELLKELAIMQKMGSHPNVVTLLGCCTDKGNFCNNIQFCFYYLNLLWNHIYRTISTDNGVRDVWKIIDIPARPQNPKGLL